MSTPTQIAASEHPGIAASRGNAQDASALYRRIKEQIEEHPYRTAAVVAGLGLLLGHGGLLGRAASKLIASGFRVGLAAVVTPLATQLVDQIRGRMSND